MRKMKRVHLIGVGGAGMSGLALLLKAKGCEVTGCDLKPSARTDWLERNGVKVFFGHDVSHVNGVDEVVATPAISRAEPEFVAAKRVRFRGEALAELVNERDSIAVCGSHGKTTTATWTAKLLKALGEDVAWAIGGESNDFPPAGIGSGPLVVEADESDGTLALYRSTTLVVNRCEYDHPDFFKTERDYFACFERAKAAAKTVIDSEALATLPELESVLKSLAPHNRKNARAAVEVALRRGHSLGRIAQALPEIVKTLPDRRFQKIGENVYIDYAHHPTEMKCALGMARKRAKGRLIVIFQPHRYSRTRALLKDFPAAFEGADEVVLCPTYAAFEKPVEGGDIADLYRECRERLSIPLYLARRVEEAWTHAKRTAKKDDLVLVLGAGDLVDKLVELKPPRHWIGAGSNTWKSDLNLGEEYVKSEYPSGRAGATLAIPWMAGIPGTIGGWVKMNAGAFGHSISEVIDEVNVDGEWRKREACGFGYRRSAITGEIRDVKWNEKALAEARADKTDYFAKRKRFPAHTWGSFFKNPEGDAAGRLLEAAGAKTLKVGGAFVWGEHANVIVAPPGEATASDVLALARLMMLAVYRRFGVRLESEVAGILL